MIDPDSFLAGLVRKGENIRLILPGGEVEHVAALASLGNLSWKASVEGHDGEVEFKSYDIDREKVEAGVVDLSRAELP